MQACVKCGEEVSDKFKFCPKCGEKLQLQIKFCSRCGTEMDESFTYCPECGEPCNNLHSKYEENDIVEDSSRKNGSIGDHVLSFIGRALGLLVIIFDQDC